MDVKTEQRRQAANDAKKTLNVLLENSVRKLVERINAEGIGKDDIVDILRDEDSGYFLLYYK